MKTSNKGIELIKGFESLHLDSYMCPAGCLTIGWGHTKGVREGQRISLTEAEKLLKDDIAAVESCISKIAGLKQHQFDALVSFVFNVGVQAFENSTLKRLVIANKDDTAIVDEFMRWIYGTVGGRKVVLPGLVRRRKAEADMYIKKT